MTKIKRLKAFVMWCLYFVCSTDMYLRLNGYDPNEVGEKFSKYVRELLQEQKR